MTAEAVLASWSDLPRALIRRTLYPLLLSATLWVAVHAVVWRWPLAQTQGITVGALAAVLIALETWFPLREEWRMTRRSFWRDLRFIAGGSATLALVNGAWGLVTVELAARQGPLSGLPAGVQAAVALVVFELAHYLEHRASHELWGPVGRALWRMHAPHHVPDRVYVLMHAVFHPANLAYVRAFFVLFPLWALGLGAEATFVFSLLNALHALISHANLDVRAGWLNYVFVGPELHRFHHSADVGEAQNYGAVVSIWDLALGTFVYRPGELPARLGMPDPDRWPAADDFWGLLVSPFRRGSLEPAVPEDRPVQARLPRG
jgi:sterol desaturase/sphingolipid hydroxylase (fatty acid hydroxylase superfamily)